MKLENNIYSLALEFSRVLRSWLDEREMATVIERNETAESYICHSHDFCDANMAMDEAWRNLKLPLELIEGEEEETIAPNTEECMSLWSAAWGKAKENRFSI